MSGFWTVWSTSNGQNYPDLNLSCFGSPKVNFWWILGEIKLFIYKNLLLSWKISKRDKERQREREREKSEKEKQKEKERRKVEREEWFMRNKKGFWFFLRQSRHRSRSIFFFTKFSTSRATENQFQQSNSLISLCFLFYLLFLNLLSWTKFFFTKAKV